MSLATCDWSSNPKAGQPNDWMLLRKPTTGSQIQKLDCLHPKTGTSRCIKTLRSNLIKWRRTSYVIQTLTLAHQQLDNQTQATGTLTRVYIYSKLYNQSTHMRTNPRSWYQSQHLNDVVPTYQNAAVCLQQAKQSISWIQTRYQLSLNTTHPDFTKTTDARASDDSALSFPLCAEWLATTVHRLGVVASGNPGFTAGRDFNPAGGAPGGNPGFTAGRDFNPAGGAPGGG
ncbi:ent-kaur-16-ene synthase, chloroplastic [Dorcoceras hygrometricum]|uniref:Ent-kaur-16-ene synthase, chloroplastic n=1 Tax=Dorcoceras hygrometricum TaxID=472368 RepID=A0A2Z7AN95_9LAMI|nr:ent-kaur-16-ene synthase, chloroplastic [Dorcoceras hygrometricum]